MPRPTWRAAVLSNAVLLLLFRLVASLEGRAAAELSGEDVFDEALVHEDECQARRADGQQHCALEALQLRRGLQRTAQGLEGTVEELEARPDATLGLPPLAVDPGEAGPATETCKMTAMKLRYGAEVGVFGLPGNASVGAKAHHTCEFQERTYPHGEVIFECRSDRWHYKSDTCSLCPAASIALATGSVNGTVSIQRATKVGARSEGSCEGLQGSQAVYLYGSVSFTCQEDGTWSFDRDTCSVCPESKFNLTYGGDPGLFTLPAVPANGVEIARSCHFQHHKFPVGSVKFKCVGGSWKFSGDTCAACAAQSLTVKNGDSNGTFELPRYYRIGGEYALRCSFGEKEYNWGQVNFECREKGWAFVNQTCSACAASGPFNVTYGHDVGVFELPSAESDGEIQDMPCKFGTHLGATSFSSGVVRFACKGGRWRLQTVTCVNSGAEEPPEPSTPELQG